MNAVDHRCDVRINARLLGYESGEYGSAEDGEDCGEEIEGGESATDDEDRVAAPLAEA